MNKRHAIFLCVLALCAYEANAQNHQLYRWKDKDGRMVIGDAPPDGSSQAEKIEVKDPPTVTTAPPARGGSKTPRKTDWRQEDDGVRSRLDERRRVEAETERNNERKQRVCEEARARRNYVEGIQGRAVWRTDPATGEQTLLPDDERAKMESETAKLMRENNCE